MTDALMPPNSINLSNEEAAEYMRISPRTLEKLRTKRRGPAYHKIGRRVVYVLSDLQAYIAQHRCDTAESAPNSGAAAP
jgi:excisionase family DNA binding protein